jgi:hypothetical protein
MLQHVSAVHRNHRESLTFQHSKVTRTRKTNEEAQRKGERE